MRIVIDPIQYTEHFTMTNLNEELIQIADSLDRFAERGRQEEIQQPLDCLEQAVHAIGNAWSDSWLGYHANVYYQDFRAPPPGAHFNKGWGLKKPAFDLGSTGDWVEYAAEYVKAAIFQRADCNNLEPARTFADEASVEFSKAQRTLSSIIELELADSVSPFLTNLEEEAVNLTVITENQFIQRLKPSYNFTTYDEVAGHQGIRVPPHLAVLSEVHAIQHTIDIVASLSEITRQVESHVSRRQRRQQQSSSIGTRVFIGHGHSQLWRELKDFIQDQLGLQVDEFNRVQTAGVSTIGRLTEMMDSSGIAFLVMTGEDEQPTGELRPRENVVHEAGLFQGRLGFQRAIVLLENGCEKFSNNAGLTHVDFPKGNIRAAFWDVKETLEREELLNQGTIQ